MFPRNGAPMETNVHFQSLTYDILLGPPKGTLPPGSPHRAPSEKDALFPEPSFIHLSKSLVNEPPSKFTSGAPMERDACLQSLPLNDLQGPQ